MKTPHLILRGKPASREPAFGTMALKITAAALHADVDELGPRDVARLNREAGVLGVAPVVPMKLVQPLDDHPTTPQEAGDLAWGVRAVGADLSPFTGAGVVVAVLDTGIDAAHPAFAGVELERRNFTDGADDDTHGHGTHCAGTIFGRRVGATRIGIAPGVRRALIGKVLGGQGGSNDSLVRAMLWAADEGAHVISMSLGVDFTGLAAQYEAQGVPPEVAQSRTLQAYRSNVALFEKLVPLLNARQQTMLIVAAAGNESRRDLDPDFEIGVTPPATAAGIVSVAALGRGGDGRLGVADFSNTGALIAAPGVDIVSAGRDGGLRTMSGTSMATPHVAGVAALWAEALQRQGSLTLANLTGRLIGRAGFDGLRDGIDPGDVGAGLAFAPQR